MTPSLSSANGAARERSRAFLDGWQLADRTRFEQYAEGEKPYAWIDLDMEPTTPVNGVLLACFLRGMMARFAMRTDQLEEHLLTTLDYRAS